MATAEVVPLPPRARRPAPRRAPQTRPTRSRPAPSAKDVRRRTILLGIGLSVLLLLAVGKLTDLQVIRPTRYLAKGAEQRIVSSKLQAARGAILDRNGQDLALSVPRSTVYVDQKLVTDVKAEAAVLAEILDRPRSEMVDLLTGKSRFVYIERQISDAQAKAVDKARGAGRLDGVEMIDEFERIRPGGDLGRSLIGMTDIDGTGISGLESQYDKTLLGRPGEIVLEQSSMGAIAGGERKVTPSVPGDDVVLSVDKQLQFETERLVAEHIRRTGSKGGIAILTKPSTGEILAMVNMVREPAKSGATTEETAPGDTTVDPEPSDTDKIVPSSNNMALTTVFEPGSVNKVITVAAALEQGQVNPGTVLDVPDNLVLGEATFGEAEALPNRMSVTDILTVSSNIGTIELARGLGKDTVDRYLRKFGFGTATGLDFPNESSGLLLDPKDWSGSSIGSIPIGQGVSVTPMQMLEVYNTIANDGRYVAPELVTATVDSNGVRHPTKTRPDRRVISAETARQVRGILAKVVESGTGAKAAVPGYQVAGKTGTARKPLTDHAAGDGYLGLDGRYHYVSTFVGMVPAADPQLSIIVVLDEPDPSKSYYASDTSAPLFGDLARMALRQLRIPPSAATDVTAGVPEVSDGLLGAAADEPVAGTHASSTPTTVAPPETSGDTPTVDDQTGN